MIKFIVILYSCIFILPHYNYAAPFGGRIVNGTKTNVNNYPYMVSVKGSNRFHMCGGTIISDEWVVTAAHCIVQNDPSLFSVQYGVTNITQDGDTVMGVSEIYVHGSFNSMTLRNDIALLHLKEHLKFNENVQPIQLPGENFYIEDGGDVELIGWGLNASNGVYQQNLQLVDLKVISYNVCNLLYWSTIYSTNICAAIPSGGKGQCEGDSGGPLIYNNIFIGITSWSNKPCASVLNPGVFTNVPSYIPWIRGITGL